MEKLEAHQKGVLHRAFSVFVFNKNGELLLQQRAAGKYHSPLQWTNTCCSHQRAGESAKEAAQRRLREEMGIQCDITFAYSFLYKADVGQGLYEHELDHVFIGYLDDEDISYNKDEVHAVQYASVDCIENELKKYPDQFTVWFRITFNDLKNYIHGHTH